MVDEQNARIGRRVRSLILKIVEGIIVILLLMFAMKGCILTVWNSPDKPITYAVHGADGRSLSMIFLPQNRAYVAYTEEKTNYAEVTLCEMRGSYGTHYFWRLWKIEGPGIVLGWRLYPDGAKPVVMETTVLNKFTHGTGNPTLRDKGDRTYPVILFSEGKIRYEGMWLTKETTDPATMDTLSQLLGSTGR